MSASELAACQTLVYIPQHGPGTASLNVAVAASVVLHHFATWAAYPERSRTHAKFDVGERPLRTARRGVPHAGMAELLRVVVTCHVSCRERHMCIHSLFILTQYRGYVLPGHKRRAGSIP